MRGLSSKILAFSADRPFAEVFASDDETQAKAMWLMRLRWLAVGAQVICASLGLSLGMLAREQLPLYLAVVGGLVALNLANLAMIHRRPSWLGMPALYLQMALDLAALGMLLNLSHGCSNPLVALIYLHAVLGPLVLRGRWSVAYLATTCLCLTLVCFHSQPMFHLDARIIMPRGLVLATELLVVFVIWGLTNWFATSFGHLRSEMAQMQRQRQRSDHLRALGAMAASFSHEFSTPLNTAKIRLDRLTRLRPELASDSDLKASQIALGQCEATLRDLFETDQRIGAVQMEDIDLAPCVRQVCDRWLAGRSETRLSFAAPSDDASISCRVPPLVFTRSLVDLLDNAVEAMVGVAAEIEVAVSAGGDHALVAIADRGQGVSRLVKERVGDPFISTRPGGVGLGLYTANALMEALGGTLSIRDRERGGTVVTLAFPRVRSAAV